MQKSGTAERPNARETDQLQPSSVDYAKETVIPMWDYITTTAWQADVMMKLKSTDSMVVWQSWKPTTRKIYRVWWYVEVEAMPLAVVHI